MSRARRILIGVGIAALILVFGGCLAGKAWLQSSDTKDAKAQAAAVRAYMEPVSAATRGQLRLDTYGDSKDSTEHVNGRTYFYVVVGNCPAVKAYVVSSARPKPSAKLGWLHVVIPGENPDAASAEPVIDWQHADWKAPFLRKGSGLKHCFAS